MPEPLRVPAGARLHLPYRQNLILHHKYNLLGGVLCPDLSDSNPKNDGILTNMASPSSATSGWGGQGLSFDGVNDYVKVGNFNLSGNATYALWFKTSNSTQTNRRFVNLATDSAYRNCSFDVIGGPSGNINCFDGTNSPTITNPTGASLANGNWHHFVAVFQTNNIHIYIDGVDKNLSSSNWINQTATNKELSIAGSGVANQYFNGLIDDVRIYNRALSADEVMHSYAQQEDEWDLGLDDDIDIMQGIPIELLQSGNLMGVR
jgi:hypothetical protein